MSQDVTGSELDSSKKEAVEVDAVETTEVNLDDLQSEINALRAEAAKYRKQKNDAIKERDTLKKSKETDENKSWEALYKQSQTELSTVREGTKKQAVSTAIKEQLMKQGVLTDALNDAARLVDSSIISWDADDGIDAFSVETAVKALRGSSKYLFELKVPPTGDPKNPRSGAVKSISDMTRKEFDALPAMKQAEAALKFKFND